MEIKVGFENVQNFIEISVFCFFNFFFLNFTKSIFRELTSTEKKKKLAKSLKNSNFERFSEKKKFFFFGKYFFFESTFWIFFSKKFPNSGDFWSFFGHSKSARHHISIVVMFLLNEIL